MSGHSHWSTIKHKKGAADVARGQVFSKISKIISVAARDGGGDPNANSKLRMAVEKARSINMPSDNVERAIKRGTGEGEGTRLEEVMFEAYGPGKTAIIVEGITDNKNRTLGEVKQILNQHGGKLASEGSVRWLFEQNGIIALSRSKNEKLTKEDLELKTIEAGAENIAWNEDILEVYTKPEILEQTKKNLESAGMVVESTTLGWTPKDVVAVNEQERASLEKLFEDLDENDAVQEIYSNLKT